MKLFHGFASANGMEIKKGLLHITSISFKNLRGKDIIVPDEFKRYIKNKFNKWADEAIFDVESYTLRRVMFTVAMNDKYMTVSLQHPSDVGKKKDGYKRAVNKLKRMTKTYKKEKRKPRWVTKIPTL